VSTYDRKHLPEINVDVLVHGCEVTRITTVGITAVEKDKRCIWVCLDNWLHVRWRGQGEDNVRVTETSVELN